MSLAYSHCGRQRSVGTTLGIFVAYAVCKADGSSVIDSVGASEGRVDGTLGDTVSVAVGASIVTISLSALMVMEALCNTP